MSTDFTPAHRALVSVRSNRPAMWTDPLTGVRDYISVHDTFYLEQKARFKRILLTLYHTRGLKQFRRKIDAYKTWKHRERIWYWMHGKLMPPDWSGNIIPPRGWRGEAKHRQHPRRGSGSFPVTCEHDDRPHWARGLCRSCYSKSR